MLRGLERKFWLSGRSGSIGGDGVLSERRAIFWGSNKTVVIRKSLPLFLIQE